MGNWKSKIGIDLSSIKAKQNGQEKKQISFCQGLDIEYDTHVTIHIVGMDS